MRNRLFSTFTTPVLEYLLDIGGEVTEFKDKGWIKVEYKSPWLGTVWFTIPHFQRHTYTIFIKFKNKTAPYRNLKPYNKTEQEYNFHSVRKSGKKAFEDFKQHIEIIINKP